MSENPQICPKTQPEKSEEIVDFQNEFQRASKLIIKHTTVYEEYKNRNICSSGREDAGENLLSQFLGRFLSIFGDFRQS